MISTREIYKIMIQCIRIGQLYPKKVPDEILFMTAERLNRIINKGRRV